MSAADNRNRRLVEMREDRVTLLRFGLPALIGSVHEFVMLSRRFGCCRTFQWAKRLLRRLQFVLEMATDPTTFVVAEHAFRKLNLNDFREACEVPKTIRGHLFNLHDYRQMARLVEENFIELSIQLALRQANSR